MTARKSPAKKAANNGGQRTASAANLARKYADLEARVSAIEDTINAAKAQQAKMLAAQLAKDPAQLAQMREIVAMAEAPTL